MNNEQWRVLKKSHINFTSASIHPHVLMTSRNTKKKTHTMSHRMKETNKCNLCEYASSNAGFIRRHMKNINVTSAIIHPRVSRNTKTLTGSKRQTSAISVSMHLPVLAS